MPKTGPPLIRIPIGSPPVTALSQQALSQPSSSPTIVELMARLQAVAEKPGGFVLVRHAVDWVEEEFEKENVCFAELTSKVDAAERALKDAQQELNEHVKRRKLEA